MPKLTITNLLTSNIPIQEYTGNYLFSVTVPAGQTKTYTVPYGVAESLESTLDKLATLGRITWTATQNSSSKLETSTDEGAVLTYTTGTRPAANAVGASPTNKVLGVNTTTGDLEYSDGTNWRDNDGNLT